MSTATRWVEIPRPVTKEDWHGHIRHNVHKEWTDGTEDRDAVRDVWERLEPTFRRGDRVISRGGMGDYDLGVYLGEFLNMAAVRFDGFEEPDGTRHEPYSMAVNFSSIEKASPAMDSRDEQMLAGYKRIKAEL